MLGWFWIFAILVSWAIVGGVLSAVLGLLGWSAGASFCGGISRGMFFLSLFPLTVSALFWGFGKSIDALRTVSRNRVARKSASHSLTRSRRRASF
ncbi:MAG: hypothetical protein O2931_00470 [Planctomycetota bacterium]|nr:hypothetical protein [Planctomycetota bacterium]MDA1177248.1 hypothetical protein [Planctomycetota bacterium]